MGLKFKDIIGAVTDVVPLSGIAKLVGKGAVALLGKKVAKTVGISEKTVDNVFVEANKIVEQDHELRKMLIEESRAIRKHELDFFGKFSELDLKTKKMRSRMRPMLTFGLIGLVMLFGIFQLLQQIFPYLLGLEYMVVMPDWLVKAALWIVAFWFTSRGIEKVVDTIRNGK